MDAEIIRHYSRYSKDISGHISRAATKKGLDSLAFKGKLDDLSPPNLFSYVNDQKWSKISYWFDNPDNRAVFLLGSFFFGSGGGRIDYQREIYHHLQEKELVVRDTEIEDDAIATWEGVYLITEITPDDFSHILADCKKFSQSIQ